MSNLDVLTLSCPCKRIEIDDWPIGSNARGTARFEVESNYRGERCVRTTTNRDGVWCKPKLMTYASEVCFAICENDRVWIITRPRYNEFITIYRSNAKHQEVTLWPRNCAAYRHCVKLLAEAQREEGR